MNVDRKPEREALFQERRNIIGVPGEKGAKAAHWKQYYRHASGRTDALTALDHGPIGFLRPRRSLFLQASTLTTH